MNLCPVEYRTLEMKKELKYHGIIVVNYTIKYPEFSTSTFNIFIRKLNHYYFDWARSAQIYCESEFYKDASEDYMQSIKEGYPMRIHEFIVDFTIILNDGLTLSLYFDIGRYTGGANGTTDRMADSWDLRDDKRINMRDFYAGNRNYKKEVENEIINQISVKMENENGYFFPDYEKLVPDYFYVQNFYISAESLIVFFDEITIAPHAYGVPSFEIPFVKGPVRG